MIDYTTSPSHEPSPSHRQAILMAWPNLNFGRAISYLLYNNIFFLYIYNIQATKTENDTGSVSFAVSLSLTLLCGLAKISTGAEHNLNRFLNFRSEFRRPRPWLGMARLGSAKCTVSTGDYDYDN